MSVGFYQSADWRKLRDEHIRRYPYCRKCGRRKGRMIVHHKKPVKQFPRLKLSRRNLETLCLPCHNMVESMNDSKRYKSNGWRVKDE